MTQSLMIVGGQKYRVSSDRIRAVFMVSFSRLTRLTRNWMAPTHTCLCRPFTATVCSWRRRLILSAATGLGFEPLYPGKKSCLR